MNNITITAIMLTCGRVKWIGDAIASFVQQTYQNKQLIILDTHPQDILFTISLPKNIQYLKAASRDFASIGDKTKHALSLVKTPFVCMWEDDDIWLPWHLEQCMEFACLNERDLPLRIGCEKCYFLEGDGEQHPFITNFTKGMCWCRLIFEHRNEHWQKAQGEPYDLQYMNLFWKDIILPQERFKPSYIYRWNNGQRHLSGFYGQKEYSELYRFFEDEHSKTDISNLPVEIKWKFDYLKLISLV